MRHFDVNYRRKQAIKLTAIYIAMVSAVTTIVAVIVFLMVGFHFNNGQIEQYAFLQFRTIPSGAKVSVDGIELSSKTPTKTSLPAGKHEIIMKKDNYEEWRKTVDVKSGTMTWLKNALLIPKKITTETVVGLVAIYDSLASPDNQSLVVQEYVDKPIFELIDVSSDMVKTVNITLPTEVYSASTAHAFKMEKWDKSGRYVLIKHTYDNQEEWLVIDTRVENSAKNITKIMNLEISSIFFLGNGGDKFYVLSSGEIKKIDITSPASSSKIIASNVSDMVFCSETNAFVYIYYSENQRVIESFRDGDDSSHILKTISKVDDLKIAVTHYFNEEYVAIAEGKNIEILGGNYSGSDSNTGLRTIETLTANDTINLMEFSPAGEYLLIRTSGGFSSYDLEYRQFSTVNITASGSYDLDWLNENYLWTNIDGKLAIREFDGANMHVINQSSAGQDVVLTTNNRYIYSIVTQNGASTLQCSRLFLP